MFHRLPLAVRLGGALLALGCYQELNPNAAQSPTAPTPGLTTNTRTPPIEVDFTGRTTNDSCQVTVEQATKILEDNCAGCHSGRDLNARQGQFDFLFDFERLKAAPSSVADLRDAAKKMRFAAPGDPDNSRVYGRISRGEMPPPDVIGLGPRPRPTVSDISLLRQWITACMGGPAPPSLGGAMPPPLPGPPPPPGMAPAPPAPTPPAIDPPPAPPPVVAPPAAPPAPPPGGAGELTLDSPALEGGIMPIESSTPRNESPALSWRGGPSGARSYAVALTGVQSEIVLWVIWDIPAGTTALPANIEENARPSNPMGSRQLNYQGNEAYVGPSANANAAARMYRFDVWALDVDTLDIGGIGGGGGNANQARTAAIVEAIKGAALPDGTDTVVVRGNRGN